jgi:TRAP-type C4-dicarboxylate transport system permease small subunit
VLTCLGNWLDRASQIVCCLMLLLMTAVVAIQVIFRYVLGASLTWSEELARYLLVWITFLGGGIALKRSAHMGLDVLTRALTPTAQGLARMISVLCVSAFLCTVIIKGAQLALFNMSQYSPAMGVPMGTVYLAIPTGCLVMLVQVVEQLTVLLRSWPNMLPRRPR